MRAALVVLSATAILHSAHARLPRPSSLPPPVAHTPFHRAVLPAESQPTSRGRGDKVATRAADSALAAPNGGGVGGKGPSGDKVSLAVAILTLVKVNLGVSPMTFAQTIHSGNGLLTSVSLILAICMLGAYTFIHATTAVAETQSTSLKQTCERTGLPGARLVDFALLGYTGMCLTCYVPFTATTLIPLLRTAGVSDAWTSTSIVKAGLSLFFFLPMSFMRLLKSARWTSALGNASCVTVIGVLVRRLLDGAYAPGGQFAPPGMLPREALPLWGVASWADLVNLAMRTTFACSAQYNTAKFAVELDNPTPKRIRTLACVSYSLIAVSYIVIFLTSTMLFGRASQAPVLMNFADADPLAYGARWLYMIVTMSIYPLVFGTLGSRVLEMVHSYQPGVTYPQVALALTALIGSFAMISDDVGKLLDLLGALFVQLFFFIIPIGLRLVQLPPKTPWTKKIDALLLPLGASLAASGLASALSK